MRPWLLVVLACAGGCRDGRAPPAPTGASSVGAGTLPHATASASPQVTAKVKLRATQPDGVPLHPEEGSSAVSGRLAAGSEVEVLARSADGRWLEVRASDGTRGFVTKRYVAGLAAEPGGPPKSSVPSDSPWASLAACERALASGQKLERPDGVARLGTWNVRWFPDGKPGKGSEGRGTNLPWLACIIAWSRVDALAVQEFKTTPSARAAVDEVLRRLEQHSGGKWRAAFDDCPNAATQHVGLLYDTQRVRAKAATTLGVMNPHGEACKDSLRPGFAMHLTFPKGLDFHFVSVHSKSGSERRSIGLRQKTLSSLGAAQRALSAAEPDSDVLFAGDFNTMGCRECSPAISAEEELVSTDRALAALPTRYRRVPASSPCSEYHHGRGTLLDHFVASAGFSELAGDAKTRVSGICADVACAAASGPGASAAERELSDHCPLFLDIPDTDLD